MAKTPKGIPLFFLLAVGTAGLSSAGGLEEIEKFLSSQCVILTKSENNLYVCDKGLPYFRVGFPVAVYRGTYVENPLTGQKTFVLLGESGKGVVTESFKTNSLIRLTENKGVKRGDIARLDYDNICFSGSEYAFEKLQKELPLVKSENASSCRWAIVEKPDGYALLFKGKEVFFAPKELPSYAYAAPRKADLRELNIFVKAYELGRFKEIPVGVDTENLSPKVKLVAVGFPDWVALYQYVGGTLTPLGNLPVPNGQLVGIRLVKLNGTVYILGNAVTPDAQAVSFVAKMVGTNAAVVKDSIPYLFGVLKKGDNPLVVAQKFDGNFGESYTFDLSRLEVGGKLNTPDGFRADTAVLSSDGELAFIDNGGTLRIFKGSFKSGWEHYIDIEGSFGKSYTAVGVPSVVGDTTIRKVFFPPHPVEVQLFGFKGFLVAENESAPIVPLLGEKVLKFKGGRLVFIGKNSKGLYEKKPLRGFVFEDAVQGIAIGKEGLPFVVSGYKNPFLFKKGGKIYRVEFRYF